MMQTSAKLFTALLLGTVILVPPAHAQFRDGQPETIPAPPPRADPGLQALARFRQAYARAGSPRIVVFWNREFDEEVASSYQDKTQEHEVETTDTNGLEETTQGPSGQSVRNEGSAIRERKATTTVGAERVSPKRGRAGTEAIDWQIENAFTETLVQGGVRLVDRKLAMRLTAAARSVGERANVQEIETLGMAAYSDILVEVLQSSDARAPGGVAYRISARDLRSARPLATVFTAGRVPTGPMAYVAGPDGFVRATPAEQGPSGTGSQLALDLMSRLAAVLR